LIFEFPKLIRKNSLHKLILKDYSYGITFDRCRVILQLLRTLGEFGGAIWISNWTWMLSKRWILTTTDGKSANLG